MWHWTSNRVVDAVVGFARGLWQLGFDAAWRQALLDGVAKVVKSLTVFFALYIAYSLWYDMTVLQLKIAEEERKTAESNAELWQYQPEAHVENVRSAFVPLADPAGYTENPLLEQQLWGPCFDGRLGDGEEHIYVIAGPKEIGKSTVVKHLLATNNATGHSAPFNVLWIDAADLGKHASELAPVRTGDSAILYFAKALDNVALRTPDFTKLVVIDDAQKLMKTEEATWFVDSLSFLSQWVRVVFIVSDRVAVKEMKAASHWGTRLRVTFARAGMLADDEVFKEKFAHGASPEVRDAAIKLCGGNFGLYNELEVPGCQDLETFRQRVSDVIDDLEGAIQAILEDVLRPKWTPTANTMLCDVAAQIALDPSVPVHVHSYAWKNTLEPFVEHDILTQVRRNFVVVQNPVAALAIERFVSGQPSLCKPQEFERSFEVSSDGNIV